MAKTKFEVVGISGKAETGKDHCAKILKELGYYQISLAWHFKIWSVGKHLATYEEIFHTKPPHIRTMLQQEGTELGRNVYGQDIWLDTMYAWMQLYSEIWDIHKFVVPDVRFKSELNGLKDRGAQVFRIIAPKRAAGSKLTEEQKAHISETDLDDVPLDKFDGIIYNDPEQAATVRAQIRTLLGLPPNVDSEEIWNKVDEAFDKANDAFELAGEAFKNVEWQPKWYGRTSPAQWFTSHIKIKRWKGKDDKKSNN